MSDQGAREVISAAAAPAVRQIERAIRERIETGELSAGDRLPSRAVLAEQLQVSPGTVAQAVRRLREAGLVTSDTTGVYVAPTGTQGVAGGAERASRAMSEGKIYPPSEQALILSASLTPAPDEVAQALGMPVGAEVIRRERVTRRHTLGSDPTPITWSISWLAGVLAEVAPELVRTERIPGGTVGLIRERTGRIVTTGADRISARGASTEEARALAIPAGLPVLVGTTTWTDQNGDIVEWDSGSSHPAARSPTPTPQPDNRTTVAPAGHPTTGTSCVPPTPLGSPSERPEPPTTKGMGPFSSTGRIKPSHRW